MLICSDVLKVPQTGKVGSLFHRIQHLMPGSRFIAWAAHARGGGKAGLMGALEIRPRLPLARLLVRSVDSAR